MIDQKLIKTVIKKTVIKVVTLWRTSLSPLKLLYVLSLNGLLIRNILFSYLKSNNY